MKKLNLFMIAFCFIFYILDILLVQLGKIEINLFLLKGYFWILLFLSGALFFFLKPTFIRWCGQRVPREHIINNKIGHIVSTFFLVPVLVFLFAGTSIYFCIEFFRNLLSR